MAYLPAGLPAPLAERDGLDRPYWEATRQGVLKVQRCGACNIWQWGPEWLCHHCRSWNMRWVVVEGSGRIWSWTRCWHPVHPVLRDHGPYIAVVVELPHAGTVRMLGNLLGDPFQDVAIDAVVGAEFEPHDDVQTPYTLVQWRAT